MQARIRSRSAFTLIELLVVIAIISVLIGLLLPAVQKVRESAARMSCQNNMKQLGLAVHVYENTYQKLPPGAQGVIFPSNGVGTSWLVFILPNIEQSSLKEQYSTSFPYNYTQATPPVNNPALVSSNVRVPGFYCPSGAKVVSTDTTESGAATTHYYAILGPGYAQNPMITSTPTNYSVVNPGTDGAYSAIPPSLGATPGMLAMYEGNATLGVITMSDVVDGTSNTIMLGERSVTPATGMDGGYRAWTRGNNGGCGAAKNLLWGIGANNAYVSGNLNDLSMASNHSGGTNFAFGDGSVRFVSKEADVVILRACASINNKEVMTLP